MKRGPAPRSALGIVEKFVGIDVSKSTLDVCIEPDVQTLHVVYDEAGIKQLVARLKEVSPTLRACPAKRFGYRDRSHGRIGSPYRD